MTMIRAFCLALTLILTIPYAHGAIQVQSPEAGIDLLTGKVATIASEVTSMTYLRFQKDMAATHKIKGDRIIVINSPGGEALAGASMLKLIDEEKSQGTRIVCVVTKTAYSMAFNILTHCDVRLGVKGSSFLFHPVALYFMPDCQTQRVTAARLKKLAKELDAEDEPYRQANAKALGFDLELYDLLAARDLFWRDKALIKNGYLHGTATIKKL